MTSLKRRLTNQLLDRMAPPRNGRIEVGDELCPGPVLRVTEQGAKSFSVIYRVSGEGGVCEAGRPLAGRQYRITLGRWPVVSLADARERVRTIIARAGEGVYPRAEQAAAFLGRRPNTFSAVLDRHVEQEASRTISSWQYVEQVLRLHVVPRLDEVPMADIRRPDVHANIDDPVACGRIADEAHFVGNPEHAAKLNTLIMRPDLFVEPKSVDGFVAKQMFRLIFASNDERVICAELDDRRNLMLNVDAGEHNRDGDYFAAMAEEWRCGGRSALFRWLTGQWWREQVGEGRFRMWKRPMTEAPNERKDPSLPPAQMLVHNMLRDGEPPSAFAQDTSDAPLPRYRFINTVMPWIWKSGRKAIVLSSSNERLGCRLYRNRPVRTGSAACQARARRTAPV